MRFPPQSGAQKETIKNEKTRDVNEAKTFQDYNRVHAESAKQATNVTESSADAFSIRIRPDEANPFEVPSISRFSRFSRPLGRPTRVSKSRRIIVSATGRERGFTESLAAFPEKSEGKRPAEGRGGGRGGRTEAKEGR